MLLKLKENIDMKELIKYGYIETDDCFKKRVNYWNVNNLFGFYETLEINKHSGYIRSVLYNDLANMYWYNKDLGKGHYLQDLFDANMIEETEKVGDNQ